MYNDSTLIENDSHGLDFNICCCIRDHLETTEGLTVKGQVRRLSTGDCAVCSYDVILLCQLFFGGIVIY